MPESVLVSIITICYNAESIIRETMLSVLQQSYEDLEYLIIDGGSSDRTVAIAEEVASMFPGRRVEIHSGPDQGIADAMNKGISFASGLIINHLHAGDRFIDETVLERVVASYRAEHWRWAVAGSIVIEPKGLATHVYRAQPDPASLLVKNSIPHQSTFLLKDLFETHGMFDVEYKQAMDYELWLRFVFMCSERYVVLPFNTTCFLDGGRSANIFELLHFLYRLRRALPDYQCKTGFISDVVFLGRVLAFHYYYALKKMLVRARTVKS